MMKNKTKNWTPKFVALAVVCLLIGVGIGLLGYHYLQSIGMKLPGENPAGKIYPENVKFTYFDDSKKINNIAGFLIKLYEPIAKDEKCSWKITREDLEKLGPCEAVVGYNFNPNTGECGAISGCKFDSEIVPFKTKEECKSSCFETIVVEKLRDSGVRLLQASEIPTLLHSLIEENRVEEVESLDFVEYVYPYKTKSTKIEPTKEMVDKIVLFENGKKDVINPKSEDGSAIVSLLTRKLHEVNLQARCVFSEEGVQDIKKNHKVVEIVFKEPLDITISQWTEPEERYHIPVDEKGYRILENVETAVFLLEDVKGGGGLEAYILIGHKVEGKFGYSCWVINIKEEGKPELDKTWIDGINRLIK